MRKLLFLLPFLLLALPAAAQTNIQAGPVDPAKCDPNKGLLWFNNSTLPPVLKYCSAVNTWTAVGTATGSTIFPWTTLGFSATPALTVNNGSVNYFMPVTGNVTGVTTVGSAPNGTYLGINFQQDGTGGHTIPTSAFPGNFVFPTGCNFDLTANANNFFAWTFDGTNWQPVPGTCGKIVLQTNGTPNGSQSLLNLAAGAGATLSDNGTGTVTISSATATTGAVGTLQKTDGSGNHVASGLVENSSVLTNSDDNITRGPNPSVDVRYFGAVPINPNIIPAPTATTTGGSPTVTVSSASGLQKNVGLAIVGGGAAQTMTTPIAPTVTPSCAANLTGLGLTVPVSGGGTSYAYAISMIDQGRGWTAASTNGTTSTGFATLGARSTAVTSIASGATNTFTAQVASTSELAAGCLVEIDGTTDDGEFGGWKIVASIVDSTHFTFTSGVDASRGISVTTATGGTVRYWLCNHLVLPTPGANGTQYMIYGNQAGSLAFQGLSLIANLGYTDASYNTFDDYGATMMASPTTPWWVPASPPASPVNDLFVSTITNISGTTLTMAANATTSVTTSPSRFDNAPNILAAQAAANTFSSGGGGTIRFTVPTEGSSNWCYVTSSPIALTIKSVIQDGAVCLGDTITLTGTVWEGTNFDPIRLDTPTFYLRPHPLIDGLGANPVLFLKNTASLENVSVKMQGNVAVGVFATQQISGMLRNSAFTSAPANSYLAIPFYDYEDKTSGGFGGDFHDVNFSCGYAQVTGSTSTPGFVTKFGSQWNFDTVYANRCGFALFPSQGSDMFHFYMGHEIQGNITPLITAGNIASGNNAMLLNVQNTWIDTGGTVFAILNGAGTLSGNIVFNTGNFPSAAQPLISGQPNGGSIEIIGYDLLTSNIKQVGQNINVNIVGGSGASLNNGQFAGITSAGYAEMPISYAVNHTLQGNEGAVIATTSGITFTLLHALRGQTWDISNTSAGTITIAIDSGTLSGGGATGPITVPANTAVRATCDGTNCSVSGLGGGAGGSPGGTTDALQYNGGGGSFGGVNSPTANGNYSVNYNVTASAAVAPTINLPGVPVNPQTGTTYTYLYSDRGSLVTANNAGAQTYTLVNPSTAGFGVNYFNVMKPIGTGTVTENASGFTINGGTSLLVPPGVTRFLWSDGVNYTASRLVDLGAFTDCVGGGNAVQFTAATGKFSCGAASAGVASLTGDGALITNSLSTGAVTLTLGTAGAHKVWMNNTGSTATPGYQSIGEADLPAATVFTDKANTMGAFLTDFSASTVKIPTGAGCTASASAMICYDSTNKNWHIYDNNADAIGLAIASAPTTGNLADYSVVSSNVLAHDSGIATANVVTAASNYTSGNLVKAAASNKTTSDSGIAAANVVIASSPGAGIAHFAGSTQTVTSSTIATADIAANAVTSAKVDGSVCAPGSFSAQTDGATVTWAIGSVICANASLTFTVHSGSRTLNITNPVNGGSYVLWIKQDATGGEGLTLGTGCTWKVSGGGGGAITPSTGANAIDVLAFTYDGTNCYANFAKNFN